MLLYARAVIYQLYFPDPIILSAQEEVYTVIEGQFVTVCLSIPHNELPRTLVQLNASLSGGNGTGMTAACSEWT